MPCQENLEKKTTHKNNEYSLVCSSYSAAWTHTCIRSTLWHVMSQSVVTSITSESCVESFSHILQNVIWVMDGFCLAPC